MLGPFERGAAPESHRGDGRQQFRDERAHLDIALEFVIRADDLFGGMFVWVWRGVLHDQPGDQKTKPYSGNNRDVMSQKVRQDRRPHPLQDDLNDQRDEQPCRDADQGRNKQPFVQIAGIGLRQILMDQRRVFLE